MIELLERGGSPEPGHTGQSCGAVGQRLRMQKPEQESQKSSWVKCLLEPWIGIGRKVTPSSPSGGHNSDVSQRQEDGMKGHT